MSIEEKAKAYDEAMGWIKEQIAHGRFNDEQKDMFKGRFPELAESKDERIRQAIVELVKWVKAQQIHTDHFDNYIKWDEMLSYLEKLKEFQFGYPGIYFYDGEKLHFQGNPAMEEKQKEYISNIDAICLSAEIQKPYRDGNQWCILKGDNIQEGVAGFGNTQEDALVDFIRNVPIEKQKKPHYTKRNAIFDKCVENCDPKVMREVSDKVDEMLEKEQKSAEKQDYSGLTELERVIHRGFLCAGVENVPVEIINETAQECIAQMKSAEWSEEWKDDEKMFQLIENVIRVYGKTQGEWISGVDMDTLVVFLRRLRDNKPAEWSEDCREEDLRTRFAFYTYKDEDSVLYLSNVFVEEASRNKGFGTKILAAAEKVAETLGAISIRLKVKKNSPANAWYRKHGYGYMAFEGDYDWLEKTLEYLKPKQEWSEEDVLNLYNIIYAVGKVYINNDEYKKNLTSWLKSLRPQLHWKPSEEQIVLLEYLAKGISVETHERHILDSLIDDLKKL